MASYAEHLTLEAFSKPYCASRLPPGFGGLNGQLGLVTVITANDGRYTTS